MRYFKPKSLTWIGAIVPVGLGVFQAALPLHGLDVEAQVIRSMTGGASPYILINAGLVAIGMRGALGT